jgi:hypothetical protein
MSGIDKMKGENESSADVPRVDFRSVISFV